MAPRTLFEKIWQAHEVVAETAETPAILAIDLHLTHEVTSPQAFAQLAARGLRVRRPDRTLATIDHAVPTDAAQVFGGVPIRLESAARQISAMEKNARAYGVELLGLRDARRGIVHVIGPELGLTQPGMTIVCGDSHTSTHGAFGALAFGIGTTEVAHVLATQCLLQRKPRTLAVTVEGRLAPGVVAKDLVLAIVGRLGVAGGSGQVIEYRGAAIRALSMEERMTVCNMSIEAGARAGMVAPDETTFAWLRGRPRAPAGADFERAVERWRAFVGDPGATFDREVVLDASVVEPMISYGTNPGMVMPVGGRIPPVGDAAFERALAYMGLSPGERLAGKPVQLVFIGSCTNARLPDLRAAAAVLRGRRVARGLRMLVVPGSQAVKHDAEAEGLDRVFLEAGAEWRESGCSMCVGINGDIAAPGEYVVSTSNRNFEGRQGPGVRTLLASPATAAAAAVTGVVTDPREVLG
ncbi:MAG TPA: 3-isopropylmalate dehydratase large subunit [Steroidobacteraceae bacterium]|jgi:3-isopropylmalate/(R)-2-methylmalate dehydratase large subunit|nr:3-isopropylmalate dehydratase large subunit [Steroidobacteraceae bacterium]